MDAVVQNPQKSSGYDQGTTMRKKHVSRDSKMCCCCRFCCGAPTTDERIHAPGHRYSMMHRRLTTAGIDVAPHYHQLLIMRSRRWRRCIHAHIMAWWGVSPCQWSSSCFCLSLIPGLSSSCSFLSVFAIFTYTSHLTTWYHTAVCVLLALSLIHI